MNNGPDGDSPTAPDTSTPDSTAPDAVASDTSSPDPAPEEAENDETISMSIDDLDVYDDLSDPPAAQSDEPTVAIEPPRRPTLASREDNADERRTIERHPADRRSGDPAATTVGPPITGPIRNQPNQQMRPPQMPQRSAPVMGRPAHSTAPATGVAAAAVSNGAEPKKGVSSKVIAIVAAVALVIAAAVTWFVMNGSEKDDTTNNAATDPPVATSAPAEGSDRTVERGNASPTAPTAGGGWAAGLCVSLTEYEAVAVPIKAQASQSAEGASVDALEQIREDAHDALVGLSTEIAESSAAQSTEGKAIATEFATSIEEAVESTGANAAGLPGPPMSAEEIVGALDVPAAAFRDIIAELPNDDRAVLAAAPQCKPYM